METLSAQEASAVEALAVSPEIQAANLTKKLNDNPMFIEPALLILNECEQSAEESALVEDAAAVLAHEGKLPVQPLSALVALLVREGALAESVTVDGAAYPGSLQDAFEDESIPEEAEVLIFATVTETGRLVAQAIAPETRAASLLADRPEYARAFQITLEACDQGASTAQLHEALDAAGELRRSERTGVPQVYPSLFANLLKDAGCLRWDHAWITTDLGRQTLTALQGAH